MGAPWGTELRWQSRLPHPGHLLLCEPQPHELPRGHSMRVPFSHLPRPWQGEKRHSCWNPHHFNPQWKNQSSLMENRHLQGPRGIQPGEVGLQGQACGVGLCVSCPRYNLVFLWVPELDLHFDNIKAWPSPCESTSPWQQCLRTLATQDAPAVVTATARLGLQWSLTAPMGKLLGDLLPADPPGQAAV